MSPSCVKAASNCVTIRGTSQVETKISWFALQVRARSEIQVSGLLEQKGFEAFTPSYTQSREYSDRSRIVQVPLFPGYVFCRFNPSHRLPIITTPSVQQILISDGLPAVVSDAEINNVRRTAALGNARPYPYLSVGQKVRVAYGPLSGVEGFLVAWKGTSRLVIAADILQRAISVELNQSQVVAL